MIEKKEVVEDNYIIFCEKQRVLLKKRFQLCVTMKINGQNRIVLSYNRANCINMAKGASVFHVHSFVIST